jgi:hypothetical protein
MKEREPEKETVGKGELFFLSHPGPEDVFSGCGLAMQPGTKKLLVGLLMVDRPRPVDPEWLKEVEAEFGEYQLFAMTASGERGIACQMQIEPESLPHLCQFSGQQAAPSRRPWSLCSKLPNNRRSSCIGIRRRGCGRADSRPWSCRQRSGRPLSELDSVHHLLAKGRPVAL